MKQKQKAKRQYKKTIRGRKKTWVFGVMAAVAFVVVLMLLFVGLASTIDGMKEAAVSKEPEAILASAGVSEEIEKLSKLVQDMSDRPNPRFA